MTKAAMVVFGCDGPECNNQAVLDEPLASAPSDWYELAGGDTGAHPLDMDEGLVFCSRTCLYDWVVVGLYTP